MSETTEAAPAKSNGAALALPPLKKGKRRAFSDEDKRGILAKLRASGMTLHVFAKHHRLSQSMVRRWLAGTNRKKGKAARTGGTKGRKQREYTLDYKRSILARADASGKTLAEMEKEIGIGRGMLSSWRKQVAKHEGTTSPAETPRSADFKSLAIFFSHARAAAEKQIKAGTLSHDNPLVLYMGLAANELREMGLLKR